MFSVSRRIRTERSNHNTKAIALIAAALLFANATALFGLTAVAHAGGFPDAMHYAPLNWEKKAPAIPDAPVVAEAARPIESATPVARKTLDPVKTGATARQFSEVSTRSFVTRAGYRHPYLLIGFMTIALGAMAGVSIAMFRSLARDISENERKRNRF